MLITINFFLNLPLSALRAEDAAAFLLLPFLSLLCLGSKYTFTQLNTPYEFLRFDGAVEIFSCTLAGSWHHELDGVAALLD